MEKIIEHTFEIEGITLNHGRPETSIVQRDTVFFSLVHKGHELFENEYGKSLMQAMTKGMGKHGKLDEVALGERMFESRFLESLAAACYLKIDDNGNIINNAATVKEFKEKRYFKKLSSDMQFIQKLMGLVQASMPEVKENREQRRGNKSKKK